MISEHRLEALKSDYEIVYSRRPGHFVCPITLAEVPTAQLCAGHILCAAINDASKETVVQRGDIDHFYGGTIEPDLIAFLNAPVSSMHDIVASARDLTIKLEDGSKSEGFVSKQSLGHMFQGVDLLDRDGKPFHRCYLRDPIFHDRGIHRDMETEVRMNFSNSAMIGSLLKSAYLAMFKMHGYRWVKDPYAGRVRRALQAFFDSGVHRKDAAGKSLECFGEFDGSVHLFLKHPFADADTMKNNDLLLHWKNNVLFAVSCLFPINGQLIMVTLPCSGRSGVFMIAYGYYQQFLSDRSMPHRVHFARYTGDAYLFHAVPLDLQYRQSPLNYDLGDSGSIVAA